MQHFYYLCTVKQLKTNSYGRIIQKERQVTG